MPRKKSSDKLSDEGKSDKSTEISDNSGSDNLKTSDNYQKSVINQDSVISESPSDNSSSLSDNVNNSDNYSDPSDILTEDSEDEEEDVQEEIVLDDNNEPVILTDDELKRIDNNDIDPELVQDEQEEEEEIVEESDNLPSDNLPVITTTEEVPEPPESDKTPLEEINEERRLQRKVAIINFLREYSKAPNRSYNTVAQKLKISESSGKNYLKDYLEIVKDAIDHGQYPKAVLKHYNDVDIANDKRLQFHHLDRLAEVVLKYSNYDITKKLNTNENDTVISKVSSDNDLSILSSLGTGSSNSNEDALYKDSYNDIQNLTDGITPMQLLRFGLLHIFNQVTRNKVSNMIGPDVTQYLMDESRMIDTLVLAGVAAPAAAKFVDWLKTNSRYVSRPIGFLNSYNTMNNLSQQGQAGGQQMNGQQFSAMEDPMNQFYYQTNVYMRGFPPDHPVNQKRLLDYQEREREERETKNMDKRFNTAIKFKMMDFLDQPKGQQAGGGGLFGGMSPEMLLMMGIVEPRITMDENNKPVTTLVPKLGGLGGGGQPQQSSMDQMTSMMGMIKGVMEMTTQMRATGQDPQANLMNQVMVTAMSKAFESPQSRMDEMINTIAAIEKLKATAAPPSTGIAMGGMVSPYQGLPPETVVQLKQMELDKEFATMRIANEQKNRQDALQRQMAQDQQADANNQKIIDAVQQIAPMLMSFGQQWLMGNKQAQQGQQTPQGVMPNGQTLSPQEMAMKMHFEEQRRREAEERERKEREYRESLVQNQAPPVYYTQPPPQQIPRQETERVIVQERSDTQIKQKTPESYSESDFLTYSIPELQLAIREAEKERRKLDSYNTAVAAAIQTKVLNGDGNTGVYEEIEEEKPVVVEKKTTTTTTAIVPEQDIGDILDASRNIYEPDYDGVSDEQNVEEPRQEEEVENVEID